MKLAQNGCFERLFMIFFKNFFIHYLMKFFSFFPIQNKIIFQSFAGKSYSDNPRAIYEAMREKFPQYSYVWLMKNSSYLVPGARVVKAGSIKALFHLATAKVWIANARMRAWMVKRSSQYYVQTWHGGFALKKVEADAIEKMPPEYVKNAKHDSEMADLFISGCKWRSNNYRSAFWYDGDILECGLPRSDVFYRNTEKIKKKVKDYYKISDEKIVLYAPTFRVNHKLDAYDLDYEKLLLRLNSCWGGEWMLIIRLHPSVAKLQDDISYTKNILNGSSYPDINELISACDLLVTDYSGCMFDAMEAQKKVLLFASDFESYKQDRGTYFKLTDLPFDVAENNAELFQNIENFSNDTYFNRVECFKKELGFFCRGDSSYCAADYIVEKSGLKK